MKKYPLSHPPRFLTHHVLLRPDCLARLTLPSYLTQREANRLSAMLDALVIDDDENDENQKWQLDSELDLDGDLNANKIDASDNELEDSDALELISEELDENGLPVDAPLAGSVNTVSE